MFVTFTKANIPVHPSRGEFSMMAKNKAQSGRRKTVGILFLEIQK
jgi:hypothetical protein